jgi:hypothetical protein
MGKAYFTGPHRLATTEQAFETGSMVGTAKGGSQGIPMLPEPRFSSACKAIEPSNLKGLLRKQGRQNRWKPAGQQGLSASWGAKNEQIVTAGGGDFQGPLIPVLTIHIGKVSHRVHRGGG